MLSKHQVDKPIPVYRSVTRSVGLLAFLLLGFAANGYANPGSAPGQVKHAPEIAVGAGIGAFVVVGGGLLLLADRLRGKKKSKS